MLTLNAAQTSSGDDSQVLYTKEMGLILSNRVSLVYFHERELCLDECDDERKALHWDTQGLKSQDK